MALQNMVRVKPSESSSGTRISLNALDQILTWLTPLNLFFKPSTSGPSELRDFTASLQEVIDRLPLIAGSIYNVESAHGVKTKELVDDGRGVDLIWVDSPIPYVDLLESVSLMPRNIVSELESPDETIVTIKFTKFTCGTLAMCITISHMFVDCTSYVDLIKEWARVCRGDSIAEPLSVSSWDRDPGRFFPPPTQGAIPHDRWRLNPLPLDPCPPMMSNFFFTWESLCKLKDACTPADPNAWVSTGDCVGALVWRGLTIARRALLEPGRDVYLHIAVDGRGRSKVQPDASKYFGNLVTPVTVTLSQSALLETSLASVALAVRHTLDEQLSVTNCANILASFELSKTHHGSLTNNLTRITNWTKFPLVGEELNFGGGAPFWATTAQFPAGMIMILPQRDGYLCSLMVETDLEGRLHTIDELLTFAKPARYL